MPDFTFPPKHICILRLSAIGDICHTLPIIRTIQAHWPDTKITWIIGKTEYELIKGIDNIDFIIFNKKFDIKEYFRTRSKLKNINFDVLLHMQMSLRASLISLMIKAKIKIGFDRKRAKDGQWLFTNKKIKALSKQHVMDSLFGFSQTLGIKDNLVRWDIPVPETEQISAKKLLCGIVDYVAISPCSSKVYRNWHTKGYA
ncbi:MAG: ADP-heptose--LPS heptosyltransferase I, partial [Gammaproteobacteria bacterium]|nr:ADP-heptose--LPS heptosyltransferase I [Gammaproteobacteria bacterium]